MSDKILQFPDKPKNDKHTLTKEFCDCGNGLDLWTGTDGNAYGLCSVCDFNIGKQPIILDKGDN
jgi:hypothetical protein